MASPMKQTVIDVSSTLLLTSGSVPATTAFFRRLDLPAERGTLPAGSAGRRDPFKPEPQGSPARHFSLSFSDTPASPWTPSPWPLFSSNSTKQISVSPFPGHKERDFPCECGDSFFHCTSTFIRYAPPGPQFDYYFPLPPTLQGSELTRLVTAYPAVPVFPRPPPPPPI